MCVRPMRLKLSFEQGLAPPCGNGVWLLLPETLQTIADLSAFITQSYLCNGSEASRQETPRRGQGNVHVFVTPADTAITLSMQGFTLTPETPIAILKDDDTVWYSYFHFHHVHCFESVYSFILLFCACSEITPT